MSPHIIQWDVSFEAIQTYVKILYFNLTVWGIHNFKNRRLRE